MTRKSELPNTSKVNTADKSMESLITEYKDIFGGVGKTEGTRLRYRSKKGLNPSFSQLIEYR